MDVRPKRSVRLEARVAAAIAAMILVGVAPTGGAEYEFSAVGKFRASSTAASGGVSAVLAVNLGHCCALCTAVSGAAACAAVNYLEATRSCELVPAQGLTWASDAGSLLLLKVDVIGRVIPTAFQAVSGVLLQPGSQEETFTSYALQQTRSAAHCYSLCSSALTAVCRLFAFHSQRLQCRVYDVDFYATWTNVSTSDGNWTSYYVQRAGDWKLLYKMSKGVGVDASNALLVKPANATASANQMALDATCACGLKSGIVDSWSKFPITQVSLVLATAGAAMKYLNFSVTSADTAATFFNHSKIVASSWIDLYATSSPLLYMAIGTPASNAYGRYFSIVRSGFLGCGTDFGWLSVNGPAARGCSYDAQPPPQFAFASGTSSTHFVDAAFADALLLYAKM